MQRLLFGTLLLLLSWPTCAAVLPSSHPKHRVTAAVCERIAAAYDSPLRPPQLRMTQGRSTSVARLEPGLAPVLYVDEYLYDRCRRFGPDSVHALACVVGHELAHYYRRHGAALAFGLGGGDTDLPAAERLRLEAEADEFGVRYGYLAGYDTHRLLPAVLNAVYDDYRLPDRLRGYASRAERLAVAARVVDEFRPLRMAFEAAQALWLLQRPDEAARCLEFLTGQFPTRELFNDLGVVRLVQALPLLERTATPYAYPFEWDVATRLRRGTLRGDATANERRATELIAQAEAAFDAALRLAPDYAPAALNRAIAYSLRGNQLKALGELLDVEEQSRQAGRPVPPVVHLARAIAYARNGQPEAARPAFAQAVKAQVPGATYNQRMFEKSQPTPSGGLPDWSVLESWIRRFWSPQKAMAAAQPLPVRETALGGLAFPLSAVPAGQSLFLPDPAHRQPVKVTWLETPTAVGLRLELTDQTLDLLQTTAAFRGRTRAGVRLGLPEAQLRQRLGTPTAVRSAAGGRRFYHYADAALLVELHGGQVRGWTLYRTAY